MSSLCHQWRHTAYEFTVRGTGHNYNDWRKVRESGYAEALQRDGHGGKALVKSTGCEVQIPGNGFLHFLLQFPCSKLPFPLRIPLLWNSQTHWKSHFHGNIQCVVRCSQETEVCSLYACLMHFNANPYVLKRTFAFTCIFEFKLTRSLKLHACQVNLRRCATKQQKLEIWGKTQRESARRPKSDWGKLGGGGKDCLLYTSPSPRDQA